MLLSLNLGGNNDFHPQNRVQNMYIPNLEPCTQGLRSRGSCIISNAPRPWLSSPIDGKDNMLQKKSYIDNFSTFWTTASLNSKQVLFSFTQLHLKQSLPFGFSQSVGSWVSGRQRISVSNLIIYVAIQFSFFNSVVSGDSEQWRVPCISQLFFL